MESGRRGLTGANQSSFGGHVGVSMGAWIGALLATHSQVPVKGLIGIGASICFADELFRRLSAIEAVSW